jgi:microcystin-dependent protein
MAFWKWSRTASSNATADNTINWAEGMAPSAVNDSARAMMARLAEWRDDVSGTVTTGGSSTAYTLASNQVFDNFADMHRAMIAFVPHTTNGAGPVTLNVDGLGGLPLRFGPNLDLQSGVLIQGTPYVATYNNSDGAFYLQGSFANPYGVPVGGMMVWIGGNPPNSAFVVPIGQAISRTTYATLYAVTSTLYGSGDGSTTFNLPDLRGRAVFGVDTSPPTHISAAGGNFDGSQQGNTGGAQSQTLTQAQLPVVAPTFTGTQQTWNLNYSGIPFGVSFNTAQQAGGGLSVPVTNQSATPTVTVTPAGTISSFGSGNFHPIMPPAIVLPYILRII